MNLQQSIDAISDTLDRQSMSSFVAGSGIVRKLVENLLMNGIPFPMLLSAAKTRDRKHPPAQLCAHVVNTVLAEAENTNQVLSVLSDLENTEPKFFKIMKTFFNTQVRNLLREFDI